MSEQAWQAAAASYYAADVGIAKQTQTFPLQENFLLCASVLDKLA